MENQTVKSSRRKTARAPRFKAAFPVQLGGVKGVTKDISASGLFLELPESQELGAVVNLDIELDTPAGKKTLSLTGEIVRMEKRNGQVGLAINLKETLEVA